MAESIALKRKKGDSIKTVAHIMPNFWMILFLLQEEACDDIEKAMNAFCWGNGGSNKGIKWLLWDKICMVKEDGRLGFKKFRSFNTTLLAK